MSKLVHRASSSSITVRTLILRSGSLMTNSGRSPASSPSVSPVRKAERSCGNGHGLVHARILAAAAPAKTPRCACGAGPGLPKKAACRSRPRREAKPGDYVFSPIPVQSEHTGRHPTRRRRESGPDAFENRIGGMGLLPMPSFHTTVRTDPYTAVPSNRLNSQSDAIPRAEQSEQARSILFVSGTRLSRSWKAPDSRPPSNSFYSSLRPSSPSLWTLPVS